MRSVSLRLSDLGKAVIPIGIVGENLHTLVKIDCTKAFEEYPSAIAQMAVIPPRGETYPATLSRDGNTIIWEVTNSDLLYEGSGEIQLQFVVDETVAESFVGRTRVIRSIIANGEIPTAWTNWLNDFTELKLAAEAAEAGAESSASDSEAYAVGKRGGVDVDSDDPTYHNNSKYYRDLAASEASGQIQSITDEGTRQIGLVQDEGTTQTGLVGAEGTRQIGLVEAKGEETIASIPSDYTTLSNDVTNLKSQIPYKADKKYGGTESSTDITLTNKKAWNGTSGNQQTSNARASSEQIERTPDMLSIVCASGYSMTVYGNNSGAGNALTTIDTTWVSSVDLKNVSYKYLFIVIKKSDGTNFSDGTTTQVISIIKGEALPYATEEYVNDKDSWKLDARYTIADSQTATRNLACNHGAFNATNGGSYSGSTFPKRGVVLPFLRENNYLKLSAAPGYLITVYGNNNGVGSSFDVISNNFEAEFSLENVNKKYIAVTLKKSDDADISAVDLSDKVILTYATTQAPYLTESEVKEVAGNGDWEGRKILWLGTSIPQQGYPQIVGTMLKADVTNNAEGSSMMRIGLTTYDDSPLGDDLGITGMYHVNVLKSLSMTQEERKKLFLGWTTEQRKDYLMAHGYSAAEVANVVGYSIMMSGSFVEEDTDPGSGGIPSQKPQDIWAGDGVTYKDVREYSYGCCWDDSTGIESDLSYSGKITGSITGKLKSYVSVNDWIFFDHFRNDATDATSELMLTIPTDKYNRHYAIGAFNYLIQQIYLINPNANILIVGHYDNDDRRVQLGHVWEAQEKAANLWAIPVYKLWEESGIRAVTQFTTNGYWDTNHVWHNTGYDGTNNVMNNLEELDENKRQINGVWYHDLSLRQKWMWDDVHPLTTDCKNHIAKLIASWLKKKEPDMDVR